LRTQKQHETIPFLIFDDYRGVRIRVSRKNPFRKNPFRVRIFLLPASGDSINILESGGMKKIGRGFCNLCGWHGRMEDLKR
jgi:hypothetical protein